MRMLARLLACLSLLLSAAPLRAETLLVFTDPHFDPLEAPSAVPLLAAAPAAQWRAILDAAPAARMGQFGADPGWPLIRAALDAMQTQEPHPDVVAVLGDFLGHQLHERFNNAALADRSETAYQAYIGKTMDFLAAEIAQRFPGVPILPVEGNNDETCADYAVQPGGPFLGETLTLVQRLVGKAADPALAETWRASGSYVAHLGPHLRAVVANTVFFSIRYKDVCGGTGAEPARLTLAFLADALEAARQAGDKVWLLYHIPPGGDAYQTQRRGACPDRTVPMWPEPITREFMALMHHYRDTVIAGFAGHTHMDEFRLIGPGGGAAPDGFTLVTPAVSPIFGQNPAFARYTTDADGTLRDRTMFFLPNLEQASPTADPAWRAEYSFNDAWQVHGIDAPTLAAINRRIGSDAADRTRWETMFPVSRPAMWQAQTGSATPTAAALRVHWCTAQTVDPSAYTACICDNKD